MVFAQASESGEVRLDPGDGLLCGRQRQTRENRRKNIISQNLEFPSLLQHDTPGPQASPRWLPILLLVLRHLQDVWGRAQENSSSVIRAALRR